MDSSISASISRDLTRLKTPRGGGSMAVEGSPVYFLMTKITSFLNEVLNTLNSFILFTIN